MKFLTALKKYTEEGLISEKYAEIFRQFYDSYRQAVIAGGHSIAEYDALFKVLLQLVKQQLTHPFIFEPYHKQIREPFDYYQFGLDITSPLINKKASTVLHWNNVQKIAKQIKNHENVVLFANHQTEMDPQVISCLLEEKYPDLGSNMIYVAGGRVTSDPVAVPFSMGYNLLCIYSKKHISHPPELKVQKQLHNQRTMKLMSQLLSEGGKCIYVAPSGGRDRPDHTGFVDVAPFDPDSIEMFRLMAKQAKKRTHFYPLALATYDVLPPPNAVEKELGETRSTAYAGVHLSFGNEFNFEQDSNPTIDKRQQRKIWADTIYNQVRDDYIKLLSKYKTIARQSHNE